MIPHLDLQRVNQPYQAQIEEAIQRVARSGWYVLGKEVATFEQNWAAYCGVNHCVGVGTDFQSI